MKKSVVLMIGLVVAAISWAQAPECGSHHPQRTPELIAGKQTELMVRELGITDSVQRQQLFDFHLKYARLRTDSTTRREELNRLQAMNAELQTILTEEQFNRFMDKQIDPSHQHPQPMFGPAPAGGCRPSCSKHPRGPEGAKRLPPEPPQE